MCARLMRYRSFRRTHARRRRQIAPGLQIHPLHHTQPRPRTRRFHPVRRNAGNQTAFLSRTGRRNAIPASATCVHTAFLGYDVDAREPSRA
ncbi:hypothetical protein E2562_030478 [Oryza meyeriana var. granulata]|uniref:Uncharacterized protein n=1 Tax=Oryza meyeriana var. granulata TaxID=110450 RepID=A0A6G1CJQ1_9ORYZ|nr:hypothetical protein E2562_030478 [Oryza meyeriana var. granulata]